MNLFATIKGLLDYSFSEVSEFTELTAREQEIIGDEETWLQLLDWVHADGFTGPWESGDIAHFEPWTNGWAVGYRQNVNGVISYIYLNPSTDGGTPDVFLYNDENEPTFDNPFIYATPFGVKEEE